MMAILTAVAKILGIVFGNLDEAAKKRATAMFLEALRMKVEDETIDGARRAYAAALADPDRVRRERDKPDSGYFRD